MTQALNDGLKELLDKARELNMCNERIEQLTKERSRVDESMISKIMKLQRLVRDLNIFKMS